jgi:hypothetical protein
MRGPSLSQRTGDGSEPRGPRSTVGRREALRKAAAIGGALWIAPAVQSVNMTKAWAAVGSDLQSDP